MFIRGIFFLIGFLSLSSISMAYVPCSVNSEEVARLACQSARDAAWARFQRYARDGRCYQITGDGGVGLNLNDVYSLRRTCYANGPAAHLVTNAPTLGVSQGGSQLQRNCLLASSSGSVWSNGQCTCSDANKIFDTTAKACVLPPPATESGTEDETEGEDEEAAVPAPQVVSTPRIRYERNHDYWGWECFLTGRCVKAFTVSQ